MGWCHEYKNNVSPETRCTIAREDLQGLTVLRSQLKWAGVTLLLVGLVYPNTSMR
jgi:hypothetical protein